MPFLRNLVIKMLNLAFSRDVNLLSLIWDVYAYRLSFFTDGEEMIMKFKCYVNQNIPVDFKNL
jgi:hypothetical protein